MSKTTYTVAIANATQFTVYNATSMANIITITCRGEIVGSPNISQDVATVTIKDSTGKHYMSSYRIPSGSLICTIPVN